MSPRGLDRLELPSVAAIEFPPGVKTPEEKVQFSARAKQLLIEDHNAKRALLPDKLTPKQAEGYWRWYRTEWLPRMKRVLAQMNKDLATATAGLSNKGEDVDKGQTPAGKEAQRIKVLGEGRTDFDQDIVLEDL